MSSLLRVGMGMTTILTTVAMFRWVNLLDYHCIKWKFHWFQHLFVPSGVRQSTPRVSYVSFLDIWMVSWLYFWIYFWKSVLSGWLPSLCLRLHVWVPRGHNMFTEGRRALQRRGGNFRFTCISIRLYHVLVAQPEVSMLFSRPLTINNSTLNWVTGLCSTSLESSKLYHIKPDYNNLWTVGLSDLETADDSGRHSMHRGCHGTTEEIAKSLLMSDNIAKNDRKGKTNKSK